MAAAPDGVPVVVATGKWYGLQAILRDRNVEFDQWAQIVGSTGGLACPVCGDPLQTGPPAASGTGAQFYCRFAGDHSFRAPRDVITPVRGAQMGRYG